MKTEHDYIHEYRLGAMARDDDRCPYPISQIGRRCAWLAGYHDARMEGFA